MGARGVAMQNLSKKELDGGDGREHTVAPGGIAGLLTRANDGFWWQLGRPLGFESAPHGGDTGDHRSTSCTNMATTSFTSVRNEADRLGSIFHQLARHGPREHLLSISGA